MYGTCTENSNGSRIERPLRITLLNSSQRASGLFQVENRKFIYQNQKLKIDFNFQFCISNTKLKIDRAQREQKLTLEG